MSNVALQFIRKLVNLKLNLDFNNYFEVDPATIVEFDRNDPNVLPSVNLAPRRRIQRIHQSDDFLQSMENLKSGKFDQIERSERGIVHLKDKISKILPQISKQIHAKL